MHANTPARSRTHGPTVRCAIPSSCRSFAQDVPRSTAGKGSPRCNADRWCGPAVRSTATEPRITATEITARVAVSSKGFVPNFASHPVDFSRRARSHHDEGPPCCAEVRLGSVKGPGCLLLPRPITLLVGALHEDAVFSERELRNGRLLPGRPPPRWPFGTPKNAT